MAKRRKPRRRSYGQIKERPAGSGHWQIRVPLGIVNDKRKYYTETYHGTKTQAEARLAELLNLKSQGKPLTWRKVSFREFYEEWLCLKDARGVRERTIRQYRATVDAYILPALGDVYLADITNAHIDDLLLGLKNNGLASSTRKNIYGVIGDIFRTAIKRKVIKENPMLDVDPPMLSQTETKALTIDEMKRFLKAVDGTREYPVFLFAFMTGTRPGEYLGLQWSDIDETGAATIRRGVVWRKSGDWYLSDPKTQKSRRTLPLQPNVIKALADHRSRQNEEKLKAGSSWHRKHDFVFTDEAGEPLSMDRVRRVWRRGLQAAGLPRFKLYATRHTAATALLELGVDVKNISAQLGHSTVALTLQRYVNESFDRRREGAEKLAEAVSG